MKPTLLLSAMVLALTFVARADDKAPTKLPASADTAADVLKNSPRHGEWVDVPMGDVKIKTWVVYPEVKEKAPVVIVIHEIFGMTDWVRAVSDQLAAEGFIAVAPDLLSGMGPNGGGTESLGNQVGQTIRKLDADEQGKRLDAVRNWAIAQPSASDKTATIGFCWGGGASFSYAVHQPKLNGAVVYYGTAPMKPREGNSPPEVNKDLVAKVNCPVLGCYGGNDNRVTSTVEPTKAAMSELKKEYDPHVYVGAGHGFLRQQNGQDGANMKATEQAWTTTVEFLRKNMK
jgi:carboxymethylenebutenolidase